MNGYHYTSYHNWLKIKDDGLKPYPIRADYRKYHQDNPYIVDGVWLWTRRFKGMPHIGAVLYQFSTKGDTKIVQLRCEWDYDQQLFIKDEWGVKCPVSLGHEGWIGTTYYHDPDKHESRVIVETIPPERIELLKVYNLQEMFK